MADSTDVSKLPEGMDAYAGYVGGRWANFAAVKSRFPAARLLSIAVAATELADCLDVEGGDATVEEVPAWVDRMRPLLGVPPCVYVSVSKAQAVLEALAGRPRTSFRLWTAHYGDGAHICSRSCWPSFAGVADGTQWMDHGGWDESLLAAWFFPAPISPTPVPGPVLEITGGGDMEFCCQGLGAEWLISVGGGRIGKLQLATPADGSVFYAEATAEERNADTKLPTLSDGVLNAIPTMGAATT